MNTEKDIPIDSLFLRLHEAACIDTDSATAWLSMESFLDICLPVVLEALEVAEVVYGD